VTPLPESPARHDLVWLSAAGAAGAVAALGGRERMLLRTWLDHGRPVIRARSRCSDPLGWLSLGLPLPPGQGKRRLALNVPRHGLLQWRPPPRLAEVVPSAWPAWRAPLAALDRRARSLGLTLRVFGSLAWQHLTGERYLTETSDLDLLWCPADQRQLAAGLRMLSDWERHSRLRADGEVLLPGGAVAWRELAGAPAWVLIKGDREPMLWPLAQVGVRLPAEAAAS
jgi:phosphoribosyl-dephospho-CoA transferase